MEATQTGPRLLIFIVAYKARTTIGDVLARIPAARLPAGTEVLIIDDCSRDGTFEESLARRAGAGGLPVTVLRNPVNQGYGGNQKIGYAYAIEHGFHAVALLHGDGQYAPECLPDLAQPVLAGAADAVFGSRMLERGGARRGGMPLYKYAGNRILTRVQNRLLGMSLSEFHSGYRVYAVDALRLIPFACNTNDFHFDTEIIIQFHTAGLRIREVPIPTYYGDEICYVNGLSYAWNVVRTTVGSRLHGMGVFYQRRFDVPRRGPRYELKLGYPSSHTLAAAAVPPGSRVLDLGCGDAAFDRLLTARGCRVTGVDRHTVADAGVERFLEQDLNAPDIPGDSEGFDRILLLDVIEHLDSPEALLDQVRERLYAPRTRIVLTTPNVGFVTIRLGLFFGQFNYGRFGILDLTHKRLFTLGSLRELLRQCGYRVESCRGIPAPFPKALGNTLLARGLLGLNRILIQLSRRWFAYQFIVEATPLPSLRHLLKETLDWSAPPGEGPQRDLAKS